MVTTGRRSRRERWTRWAVLAAGATAAMALAACEPASPLEGSLTLLTPEVGGDGAAGGVIDAPGFSADGRTMVFTSLAGDLGPRDTNGTFDVYARDLETGGYTLVSANSAGTDGGRGLGSSWSGDAVIDPAGRYVAFTSYATDLGPADTDSGTDVYLRDLVTDTTTLVSDVGPPVSADGIDDSSEPAFSADGTQVVFARYERPGGFPGEDEYMRRDIYVHDVGTGETTLVSGGVPGAGTVNRSATEPTISADGSLIAFQSFGANTDPMTWSSTDVFVHDLETGATTLVSAGATSGGPVGGWAPAFAPTGHRLAFASASVDLGVADPNPGGSDVYLRDLDTGATEAVSHPAANAGFGPEGSAGSPVFSPDGSTIAFLSDGQNMGPASNLPGLDVFVRDLTAGTTTVVSVDEAGETSGNDDSQAIAFSPDGTKLAFVSGANNLVSGASGGDDVYVADLPTGQLTRVGGPVPDLGGVPYPIAYAPGGDGVAFVTGEPQPGVDDANGSTDIYLAAVEWPDLGVTMTASPSPVAAGGMLAYEAGVTNDGADPAPDAESVVVLPPEVTVVDAGPCDVATGAPTTLRCPLGDVAPGGSEAFAIGVRVEASPGDRLEAVVAVDSGSPDRNRADNLASAVVTVAEPSS